MHAVKAGFPAPDKEVNMRLIRTDLAKQEASRKLTSQRIALSQNRGFMPEEF